MRTTRSIPALLLVTASALAALPGEARAIGVWTADSMTRVLRQQPARPRITPQLQAARGEWEAFQVVLTGAPDELAGARLTASVLTGPRGASVPAPRIYREHYVRVSVSSPQTSLPPGDYPDALVPQDFPETAPPPLPWLNQPFWVDVFVPYATPPGRYQGEVQVRLNDATQERVDFTLDVWPFDLPVTPSLRSSFWVSWRRIAEVHGFDRDAGYPEPRLVPILDAYESLLAEHRLSIDQVRLSYPDAASGRLDVNAVERVLRRHLLHRHAATISLPIFPSWPFDDPLGRDRAAAQRYVADWMKILHRFRCGDRGYIALGDLDEPNNAAAYDLVRKWGAFFNEAEKKHNVRLPLMVTEQPTPDHPKWGSLAGAADIWVPHFSAVYEDMEHPKGKRNIAKRLAAGEEVWTYAALVQLSEQWKARHGFPKTVTEGHPPVWMIDYPPINHRILPWLMQFHGITGLAYWDLLHYSPDVDPWTDAGTFIGDGETFNGDGFYIYPATLARHGRDLPVASIRLKWLRAAAEDFDYLTLAKRAGLKNKALELTRSFARGFGDWKNDAPALLAARRSLGRLLAAQLSRNPLPSQ